MDGNPRRKVRQSDLKQLAGLEDRLRAKVIGQDEAVHLVAAAIKRSRVQISARRRPASFLFVGPTGVGKQSSSRCFRPSFSIRRNAHTPRYV